MKPPALLKKWTPSPVTAILLALIAWLWFRPPAEVSDENRAAAPWTVTLADGRIVSSDALRGKVVLVSFWATWCPYCRKEKPVIDAWWREHRAQGFEVVAISVDDSQAQLAAWLKDKDYRHMSGTMNPSIAAAFGPVASVPTSFVLDREGRIRHKIAGQVHAGRLDDLVGPLLARPAPVN